MSPLLLLADAGHVPLLAQVGLFRGGIWSILADTGLFARLILAVLFVFSVASWAIMIERWLLFRRSQRRAKEFSASFRQLKNATEAYALASRERHGPLARICLAGHRELQNRWRTAPGQGESGRGGGTAVATRTALSTEDMESIRRALEQAATQELSDLETRLSFLATTGSVSPFVGLLGTVWGVMTSFLEMGIRGSANLAVVAPGIAEALVATAAGLAAAIPAVVGYNYFVGRVRRFTLLFDGFSLEFVNLLNREFHS